MNEIILLKLGEVVLKGLNRPIFENKLRSNILRQLREHGDFSVYTLQGAIYVEPKNEDCDLEGAFSAMRRVFGIASVSRAFSCEKDLDAIFNCVIDNLSAELSRTRTFKVESKRADKSFPLTSIALSQQIGGRLHDCFPNLEVDVHKPEFTVHIEVRDRAAYIHSPPYAGAGGLPHGTGGRAMLLLSGGIDSPVAGYMMAKRGMELECVHFFSYPYTSEQARDKVLDLAKILCDYCGRMTVNIVPFTAIQEEIRDKCPSELSTVIMRRFMMRIAERLARRDACLALITGESLGQVASQTVEAISATDAVCGIPVFRPAIGLDKGEIVNLSRQIGTYETSILPYEDCCTVFTPKRPKTRPSIEAVELAETVLDIESLVEDAFKLTERVSVKYGSER